MTLIRRLPWALKVLTVTMAAVVVLSLLAAHAGPYLP